MISMRFSQQFSIILHDFMHFYPVILRRYFFHLPNFFQVLFHEKSYTMITLYKSVKTLQEIREYEKRG